MRHGDRLALLYLFAEKRNDRARGAEDIAKADGAERSGGVGEWRSGGVVQGHDCLLGGELRLAHNRNGVHGLVCRNKDEPLDAVRGRKLRKQLRRLGVVAPPFLGIHLDHRNMLVRRRVENDFRLLGGEKRLHLAAVVDVVHERDAPRVVHPAVDLVKSVFAALDHQNLLCPCRRNLTNDLRTNRPARASNHNDLVGEELARRRTAKVLDIALKKLVLANAARPVDAPQNSDANDAYRTEEKRYDSHGIRRTDVRERDIRQEIPHKRQNAARKHHRTDVLRKLAPAYPTPREAIAAEEEKRSEVDGTNSHVEPRYRSPPAERRRLLEIEP